MPQSQQTLFHWLSALIAVPTVAYAGQPFFTSARRGLAVGRLNMDVPISLGVLLATAMSFWQTVHGTAHVYFDAAVMLLFFLLIGRALDQSVRVRASSAAENLLRQRPTMASVIDADGISRRLSVVSIVPGMHVLIASGEQVPTDARLLTPRAVLDDSIVSGESRPRGAVQGDRICAGSVALTGPIEVESTAAVEDSFVAEIAKLMATAEQARGRYVRLADRAAQFYAPAVHILGALTLIGWLLAGVGWEAALITAISVLIITCPCALALAVPVVQVVATSRLFQAGVVLKTADALERFAEIDTIVFDKTGTLTLGRPEIVADSSLTDESIARAASLSRGSRHPYAQAVTREAERRALIPPAAKQIQEVTGLGIEGQLDGVCIRLGSAQFTGAVTNVDELPAVWFRVGNERPVRFRVSDAVRDGAANTVAALKREGYKLELLSGDETAVVASVAADLGIDTFSARQRPEQKIARLAALKAQGCHILMVGDGLNDAPALAAGHASLSPSNAADISQMAADAVCQREDLSSVSNCLEVAKAARQRAMENFAIAIGYNALFVPLAMTGRVTPLIAAIAMSASSVAVTLNALRMTRISTRSSS
jgi:P-type Cu2+ transporter